MSSIITNRTVKPFIKAHDFYPGFKLEEECFSKAVIKDVDSKSKKKDHLKRSLKPRLKNTIETGYEQFLEEAINPKTGQFYPEKDEDGRSEEYRSNLLHNGYLPVKRA